MKFCVFLSLLLLSIALASCSSPGVAQLIAEHPADEPIAIYPSIPIPEPGDSITYNATIYLEVRQVDRAAEKAILLADHFDGFMVSTNSWYRKDDKHIQLILAVPAWRFDEMHAELLRLGELRSEQISGEVISPREYPQTQYSYFTIYLQPTFPKLSLPDWRPIVTFQKAWDVFISIFGFLIDILIWILVLAGPFVLLGWASKKAINRYRKRNES